MKIKLSTERGSAMVLVMIVMLVVSIWLVSLQELTSFGTRAESRRITMNETLATADASVERAWGHWRAMTSNGSSLPTEAQLTAAWDDVGKQASGLNEGVQVQVSDVKLQQIDSLGRIMKTDKLADFTSKTDVSRGLVKRSVSYLASATATGTTIGQSGTPVKMKVNRVFQRSDIPLFQYLGFFDHTLFLHNGPNMVLNGRIHSNKRIFSQPGNGTVTINAQISGPPSNPVVKVGNTRTPNSTIRGILEQMVAQGKEDEITGFFYGTMLSQAITGISHATSDTKTTVQGSTGDAAYKYTESGKLYLFDPNDAEFRQYWGDNNGDGKDDNAWKQSTNPDINSGYRELVEVPNSSDTDTLFIASKRFYNQANIKILYNSTDLLTNGVINISKLKVYRKNMARANPNVPKNPTPAQKKAAIEDYMAYTEVPDTDTLKKDIKDALQFQVNNFRDHWQQEDHIGVPNSNALATDGNMDIMNIDMGLLKVALDKWINGAGTDAPSAAKGTVLYITDLAADPKTGAGRDKGVRLKNGTALPVGGITIATNLMAYVQGNYNTRNDSNYSPEKHPSALIADNIRLLSNNWSDSASYSDVSSRVATETTFRLAMVMGDRFSNRTETDTGGFHNFPRFLERWKNSAGDVRCNIVGAFIQLWESQFMNKAYPMDGTHSKYYDPPARHWGFADSYLFTPPPGSLDAVEYSRGRYWFSN